VTEGIFPWHRVASDLQTRYKLDDPHTVELATELATVLLQGGTCARHSDGTAGEVEPSMVVRLGKSAGHVRVDDVNEWLKPRYPFEWEPTNNRGRKLLVQEKLILDELRANRCNPLQLPKDRIGCPGIKSKVRNALASCEEFSATTSFKKAWERLMSDGRIAYIG